MQVDSLPTELSGKHAVLKMYNLAILGLGLEVHLVLYQTLNFFSCLSRDRNTLQYVNLIVTSQIFRKFSGMQNVQSRGLPQDEGKEKVGQRRQERECKVQKEDIATNQSIDSF